MKVLIIALTFWLSFFSLAKSENISSLTSKESEPTFELNYICENQSNKIGISNNPNGKQVWLEGLKLHLIAMHEFNCKNCLSFYAMADFHSLGQLWYWGEMYEKESNIFLDIYVADNNLRLNEIQVKLSCISAF